MKNLLHKIIMKIINPSPNLSNPKVSKTQHTCDGDRVLVEQHFELVVGAGHRDDLLLRVPASEHHAHRLLRAGLVNFPAEGFPEISGSEDGDHHRGRGDLDRAEPLSRRLFLHRKKLLTSNAVKSEAVAVFLNDPLSGQFFVAREQLCRKWNRPNMKRLWTSLKDQFVTWYSEVFLTDGPFPASFSLFSSFLFYNW